MKMITNEISLENFLAEEHFNLGQFLSWWRKCQEVDPDNFPEHLSFGDWMEQFNTFVDFKKE